MTHTPPLDDFTTPIVSGLTEAPEGTGWLSRERAAELDERLRGLAAARAEAEVGARSYVVSGAAADVQPCCDMHNQHCEPPSELCCRQCTEAAHDTFPTPHANGSRCVLDTAKENRDA